VGIQLVRANGDVEQHAPVGWQTHVAPEEVGVHLVVLLEGDRDRPTLAVEGEHRRGEMVELMPVGGGRHQRDQALLPGQQPRGQARRPEHRVIREEGEGQRHRRGLRLECDQLAVHARVHRRGTRASGRLVHEHRARVVLERVQRLAIQRAAPAMARAVDEMALRDVVGVEVDQPGMARRQHVAWPEAAEQRLIGRLRGRAHGRVLAEVHGEVGILGEVHVAPPAAGEGEHRGHEKHRDTLGHGSHDDRSGRNSP
jgi:hypothetical protein